MLIFLFMALAALQVGCKNIVDQDAHRVSPPSTVQVQNEPSRTEQKENDSPLVTDHSAQTWAMSDPRFPDFKSAVYYVDHDLSAQMSRVRSKISLAAGPMYAPIFDSLGATFARDVRGREVSTPLKYSPDRSTQYRVMNFAAQSGFHEVEMLTQHSATSFNSQARYTSKNFDIPWDMSDWVERGFLERYAPAPMESDLFTAQFHIRVMADGKYLDMSEFELVTNADRVTKKTNEYFIEYNTPINSSSIYVHIFKKGLYTITKDTFSSASKNDVPIVFYAHTNQGNINWIPQIKNALTRLEKLIAPWPYASVIVRAEPGSNWGMEFRGATFTDKFLIFHELAHSYFGRGVLSANGQSGYIDESIVKWLEDSPSDHKTDIDISYLRSRPPFSRRTDTRVYRVGARYIASLKHANQWSHSTLDFVRELYSRYNQQPLTDDEFQRFIKEYK